MTEQEWLECTDPTPMLEFLRGKASDRKLRLFAVECCWRIWHLFHYDDSFSSIVRVADALAIWAGDDVSWAVVLEAARVWAAPTPLPGKAIAAAQWAVREIQRVFAEIKPIGDEERLAQCHLLRDILGNPFQPLANIDPSWLTWNNGTVVKLAQAIFDNRRFRNLPILGDALEKAGCMSHDILNHCRQPGEHVRGCWVLDLMLSKE